MSFNGKLNVLCIGGGMISEEVVLPTLFQQRRNGKIDKIAISSLNSGILKRLQEVFPNEDFVPYPDLGFDDENAEQLTTPEWSVNAGYWTHVAMTFDGQHMVLYLNAAEAARKALPDPRKLSPNRRPFTIGKYFWNDAYPFVGLVGEVRIYDRVLTEGEVFRAAGEFLRR